MTPRNHPLSSAPFLVFFLFLVIVSFPVCVLGQAKPQAKTDYVRDILPVFKAHCYQCHSGSQKQGGLSLDTRTTMLKGGSSGSAMKVGAGSKSQLVIRILGSDGQSRMPLGFAPISDVQTALIRKWIDEGAVIPDATETKKHWAYLLPKRSKIPISATKNWAKNPIDDFILNRLEKEKLKPSPEADRLTLLRRVTLDLTGLPPTLQEIDDYLADRSSGAYERAVDRLLASPHYGEKMALPWLDTARYADSNGFQQDGDTYQYVWRDWVVKALNANLSFDQFAIQQLAGDLLPNSTEDQKIATGFNRCHLLNGEGGAIAEEQRNNILFDRVDVTSTAFLGATLACAQCHDHKYDPLSQRDYYSMMAFFNNVPETGTPPFGGQYRIAAPFMQVAGDSEKKRLAAMESSLSDSKSHVENYVNEHQSEVRTAQEVWRKAMLKDASTGLKYEDWRMSGPFKSDTYSAAFETKFEPEKDTDLSTSLQNTSKWTTHSEWIEGKSYELSGENSAYYFCRVIHAELPTSVPISFGSDDGIKVWVNGKLVISNAATRPVAPDQDKAVASLNSGVNVILVKVVNGGGIGGFNLKSTHKLISDEILTLLRKDEKELSGADAKKAQDYFLSVSPPDGLKIARETLAKATKERDDFYNALPKVMVMSDAQPRVTHLLDRGNYEAPKEEVVPNAPAQFGGLPKEAPKNRLGLAKWIVSDSNPLTARVQVNRYWQLFFGKGLVKTSENLGTQCDAPSHPELLDWLAVEFRESGWNVKKMHRMMVTSATYRQSSKTTSEIRLRDPENRLLSHASRFRLSSMTLRDLALSSSGLLNDEIGGKPVYPYQPKGIWDGLAITNERDFTYPQSKGKDLYRRSIYTFWRRTVAPSNMFDSSVRTTCKVRLSTTSTPLHALTTLNDETWVEAGRALAEKVMLAEPASSDLRLRVAFRTICSRNPSAEELAILKRSLNRARVAFDADPKSAESYLKSGDSPRNSHLSLAEHAAYASVCLAIYNLDEALTRE